MTARPYTARLRGPIAFSVIGHVSLVTLLTFVARPGQPPVLPPIYRVELVAAPPGPRAVGVVQPETPPADKPAETPAPVPTRAESKTPDMPAPPAKSRKAPPKKETSRATPTPRPKTPPKETATPPPVAGGGPEGGKGADVANVQTEGVEFPYPAYLNNIVRQIRLNFSTRNPGSQRADVFFIIRRDGTVDMSKVRFVTRSGSRAFDFDAVGAIEAAAKAFGPLPDGYNNDFLPVVFSFDQRIIR
jgi:outer membrane biosynthesis protein TonB